MGVDPPGSFSSDGSADRLSTKSLASGAKVISIAGVDENRGRDPVGFSTSQTPWAVLRPWGKLECDLDAPGT
jgi:hypothetical protein